MARKLDQRRLGILQDIADKIDSEVYYSFEVQERVNGVYLVPCEPRFVGDPGEYMGESFEEAKANIGDFVKLLMETD
jgi:hypothetical protein